MAAYIGNQPVPQATQTRDTFTATAGQTSFPTSGYTAGFVDVYLNGVHLTPTDYTATNGSDIVLNSGAAVGDVLEVVAFSSFDVARLRNMTLPLGLLPVTTTERNALLNIGAGDTVFNTTTGSIEFYDGTTWVATNLIPTVNSVDGTIYSGKTSSLTFSVSNTTDVVDVKYYENGVLLATDSDVAVTSGSFTVSVPSEVYGQSAGDTISITIFNLDGTPASNSISKTVIGLPTGGTTIFTEGDDRAHQFLSSGTFTVPTGFTAEAHFLVIGGGGAGSKAHQTNSCGGGGAGGFRTSWGATSGGNSSPESTITLTPGSYTITIGAGGTCATGTGNFGGSDGSATSGLGITSSGGGAGGGPDGGGHNGASGGGAGTYSGSTTAAYSGGSAISGQGSVGGNSTGTTGHAGGGGGGAGAAGQTSTTTTGGAGGNGISSTITGNPVIRAGGGGAAGWDTSAGGAGGAGGGGTGGTQTVNGVSGTNYSGGGGGGAKSSTNAGNGGSGQFIIRYTAA